MAKTLDDFSSAISSDPSSSDPSSIVEARSGDRRVYRRASAEGVVAHCFVDAIELQRLLTIMVAAELAGAMIRAQLNG